MDIGIIGGADGPTAIFLTSNISKYVIIAAGIAVVIIAVAINKRKNK